MSRGEEIVAYGSPRPAADLVPARVSPPEERLLLFILSENSQISQHGQCSVEPGRRAGHLDGWRGDGQTEEMLNRAYSLSLPQPSKHGTS